jgi:hypothetical protein
MIPNPPVAEAQATYCHQMMQSTGILTDRAAGIGACKKDE